MTGKNFILDFESNKDYPYLEEINEGIIKQLPPGDGKRRVLEVGCGRGALSAAIAQLGYEVYALEVNESISDDVRCRLKHFICADLEDLTTVRDYLRATTFSYIVFSDVLEHLYNPLQVLRNYQEFLAKDGKFLISVPNTVNWLNRLTFFFGKFNYQMSGTMDRTHIRFFTFRSLRQMVEASACKVDKVDCTPFLIRAFLPWIKPMLTVKSKVPSKAIITSAYYKFYRRYVYPLEYWLSRLWPGLLAFRIILVASKEREKNE